MPSKAINVSPFEALFGRKANTPLSNNSMKPDPNSLTYKNISNKYLDLETVRWLQSDICGLGRTIDSSSGTRHASHS